MIVLGSVSPFEAIVSVVTGQENTKFPPATKPNQIAEYAESLPHGY